MPAMTGPAMAVDRSQLPISSKQYRKTLRAHWRYMAQDRARAAEVCRFHGWHEEAVLYAEIAAAYRRALQKVKP